MKLLFTFLALPVLLLVDFAPVLAQQSHISAYFVIRTINPNPIGRFTIKPDTVYSRYVTQQTRVIQRGDFDETGTLYALARNPLEIITIDTATGAVANVAPITGLVDTNHSFTGLSFDATTSTWYALSDDLNTCCTQLYSVDINTGVFTPIGGSPGPEQGAWLEIDTNGIAYMADAHRDSLYTIDLSTGIAAAVGDLGYDMYDVRHGASIDPATNTLYVISTVVSGINVIRDLYKVDLTTGAATSLIGGFASAQFSLLAIPPNDGSIGIEDHLKEAFSVYPNPGNGLFMIINPGTGIALWNVHDQMGRLVKAGEASSATFEIDLGDQSAGIYMLTLVGRNGNLLASQKLVKAK